MGIESTATDLAMTKSIFVTGGAGYIGSHTCVELLCAGHSVTVFDNFCNSTPEALNRIERISGRQLGRVQGDVRDPRALEDALRASGTTAVMHFAGLKAVGKSVEMPRQYYDANVVGTLCLLDAMERCNVKTLIFSSSATVYGKPEHLPLTEEHPLSATNPYGRTKLVVEDLLRDTFAADASWRFALLRYFNPIGAHSSGLIGEAPQGTPDNLLPFVTQVAMGKREFLNVWGNDYETPDGTGVRDYIHVVDLAIGHLRALQALGQGSSGQCTAINLGTGIGYSVFDVVRTLEQISGRRVPYKIRPRRPGDVAVCYASPERAERLLGWRAERDLQTMCTDAWRWQSQNPQGYEC